LLLIMAVKQDTEGSLYGRRRFRDGFLRVAAPEIAMHGKKGTAGAPPLTERLRGVVRADIVGR
jgi:hypothetical protein